MIRIGRKPEESAAKQVQGKETQVEIKPVTQTTTTDSVTVVTKEDRLSGYVGNGTSFVGDANFQTILRVDGILTGQVKSEEGTLIVGATGRVDANISVGVAIINGIVNGDIFASSRVELGKTAQVRGNIETARLKIEEGAFFEGKCTMSKIRQDSEKTHQESATKQTGSEAKKA
jgi:cytoskeletal protein CcmA (bactofilin family)